MDPYKLTEVALRHELKLRDIEYQSEKRAQRELRLALRNEAKDASLRPRPPVIEDEGERVKAAEAEVLNISNLVFDTKEMTTLSTFPKTESVKNTVYAMLCHLEGRLAYVKMQDIRAEISKQLLSTLRAAVRDMRKEYFADRRIYVMMRPKQVEGPSTSADQQEEFTEKDQNEYEEMLND